MQEQTQTMTTPELLDKLGVIAAEVYALGFEEDDGQIQAFKNVIGIIGRARELPGDTTEKALADMASLIGAIRNAEPGKEDEAIKDKEAPPREKDAGKQIIQALVDECEWVNDPDEWHKVDDLINYLEDYWDIKNADSN